MDCRNENGNGKKIEMKNGKFAWKRIHGESETQKNVRLFCKTKEWHIFRGENLCLSFGTVKDNLLELNPPIRCRFFAFPRFCPQQDWSELEINAGHEGNIKNIRLKEAGMQFQMLRLKISWKIIYLQVPKDARQASGGDNKENNDAKSKWWPLILLPVAFAHTVKQGTNGCLKPQEAPGMRRPSTIEAATNNRQGSESKPILTWSGSCVKKKAHTHALPRACTSVRVNCSKAEKFGWLWLGKKTEWCWGGLGGRQG